MDKQHRLIWLDLEMTGLDPMHDVILEAACTITDNQLSRIAEGPSLVIHQPDEFLAHMSSFVRDMHTKSGLLQEVRASTVSLEQAEQQLFNFFTSHCEKHTALLCGNTVWQDRAFLARYMPRLIDFVYYRIIDVTTVKELVRRWYPDHPGVEFTKKEVHRAQIDVKDSIAELDYYRHHFFIKI